MRGEREGEGEGEADVHLRTGRLCSSCRWGRNSTDAAPRRLLLSRYPSWSPKPAQRLSIARIELPIAVMKRGPRQLAGYAGTAIGQLAWTPLLFQEYRDK